MSMHASLKIGIGFVIPLALMQGGCSNVLGFGTATKFGLASRSNPRRQHGV